MFVNFGVQRIPDRRNQAEYRLFPDVDSLMAQIFQRVLRRSGDGELAHQPGGFRETAIVFDELERIFGGFDRGGGDDGHLGGGGETGNDFPPFARFRQCSKSGVPHELDSDISVIFFIVRHNAPHCYFLSSDVSAVWPSLTQ